MENKNGVTLKHICELLVCIFYTWYFLPLCGALFEKGMFKLLFFGCFAVGCVVLFLLNGIRINGVIVSIATYMIFFSMLYIFGIGDAHRHIRISFTFWGTGLLFFGLLNESEQIRIGKYLLFLFVLTAITSSFGVLYDNTAARTLSHAGADDALQRSYALRNISSINLFQGLVYFVPIAICFPKTKKQRFLGCCLLAVIFLVLLNASFTISLIVYIVALSVSIMCTGDSRARIIWSEVIFVTALILWINMADILLLLSEVIDNYRITVRLRELSALFSGGGLGSNIGMRWEHYSISIKTFLAHPFGVGAFYSYQPFENGIGYHSKLFDDLARFGIFAILFYIVFFVGYYKRLKNEWSRVNCSRVAGIITLIYIMFLCLNLGFRSAEESVLSLYIMPILPRLIIQWRKGKCSNLKVMLIHEDTVCYDASYLCGRTQNDGVDCQSNGRERSQSSPHNLLL